MKHVILICLILSLVGCANLKKIIKDPQGRGDIAKKEATLHCMDHVKRYGRVDIDAWDKCMEAYGYEMEYVNVE